MPAVSIEDKATFDKAVGLLVKQGGSFQARAPHVLIITQQQFEALAKEGLVPEHRGNAGGETQKKEAGSTRR